MKEEYSVETTYRKMDRTGATLVHTLKQMGFTLKEIYKQYNFRPMSVRNVLRGNSYNSVTGIFDQRLLSNTEKIVIEYLLLKGRSYRDIARYTGIDANRVRNYRGYLQYKGVVR
jgi:hypothetical protein